MPITYVRKQESIPKITSYTQTYQNPVSKTNSKPKSVHFEEDDTENQSDEASTGEESEEYSNDEEYETEYETDDEGEPSALLVLENDMKNNIRIVEDEDDQIIQVSQEGMILYAKTTNTIHIQRKAHHTTDRHIVLKLPIEKSQKQWDILITISALS